MSPSLRRMPTASAELQPALAEPAVFSATNDLPSAAVPASVYSELPFGMPGGGPTVAKGAVLRKKPASEWLARRSTTTRSTMVNAKAGAGAGAFGSLLGGMPQPPSPSTVSVSVPTSGQHESELVFRKSSSPPSGEPDAVSGFEQQVITTNNPLSTAESGAYGSGASSPDLQRSEGEFRSSDSHQGAPEGNPDLPSATVLPAYPTHGPAQTVAEVGLFGGNFADSSLSPARKIQKASLPTHESTFAQQRELPFVTGDQIAGDRRLSRAAVGGPLVQAMARQAKPSLNEQTSVLVSPPNNSLSLSGLLLRTGHPISKGRTLSRAMAEKTALRMGMPMTNSAPLGQSSPLLSPQNTPAYDEALPLTVARRISGGPGVSRAVSDEKPDVFVPSPGISHDGQSMPSTSLQRSFGRGGERLPETRDRQEPQSRFSLTTLNVAGERHGESGQLSETQFPAMVHRAMGPQRSGFPMMQRRLAASDAIAGRFGTKRVEASMPGPGERFIQQVPRSITLTQRSALPAESRLSPTALAPPAFWGPLLLQDRVQRSGGEVRRNSRTDFRMTPRLDSATNSISVGSPKELLHPRLVPLTAGSFSARSGDSPNADTVPARGGEITGDHGAGEITSRIQRSAELGSSSLRTPARTFPKGSVSASWWLPMAALSGQSGASSSAGRSARPTTLQRFYAQRGTEDKASESEVFSKAGTLGGPPRWGLVPLPLQSIPLAKGPSPQFLASKHFSPLVERPAAGPPAITLNRVHQASDLTGHRYLGHGSADRPIQKAAERSAFFGDTDLLTPMAGKGKTGGSEINRRTEMMQTKSLMPAIQGEAPSVSDGLMGVLVSSPLPMHTYPIQRNTHNAGERAGALPLQRATSIGTRGNSFEAINRFSVKASKLSADNSMPLPGAASPFVSLKPWTSSLMQSVAGKATIAGFSPESSVTQFTQKNETFPELPLVQRASSETSQRASSVASIPGAVIQTSRQPLGNPSVSGSEAASSFSSGEEGERASSPSANIASPSINVDDLVEKVWKKIMFKLTLEKERRGTMRWL